MNTKISGIICDVGDCLNEVILQDITYTSPDDLIDTMHNIWQDHARREHPNIVHGTYRLVVTFKD